MVNGASTHTMNYWDVINNLVRVIMEKAYLTDERLLSSVEGDRAAAQYLRKVKKWPNTPYHKFVSATFSIHYFHN